MLKVLCFGDSITLGEKDLEHGGWADKLKKYYFNFFKNNLTQDVVVYNLGIAGETTDGLIRRFKTEFDARKINGQKTLVLISYGANDIVIHKDKNIVPQKYFIRNLIYCIEYAKENQAEIILLSLLPISDLIEGIINQHGKLRFDSDIKKYNQTLKKIALENNCHFVDVYQQFLNSLKENLLSDDGIHPNSDGHQLIFESMSKKISELHTHATSKQINK